LSLSESISKSGSYDRSEDWLVTAAGWSGVALFVLFNLLVADLVAHAPGANSVVPVYRQAALGWWQNRDIFGHGISGFIYLPTFAVLYTPFALLGPQLGDALWRLASAALLAWSLWRAVGLAVPGLATSRQRLVWGAVLLLMMPSAFGAIRNGQATTVLLALSLLGAVAIAETRWWWAATLLALAVAIKPLAIVYLLLVAVLYPPLRLRLVVATIGFLLLPLLNPDPIAALHLYGIGIHKVLAAGAPGEGRWADVTGLFHFLGLWPSDFWMTSLRLGTAAVTLGLAIVTARRSSRADAALNVFGLSIVYLMLMSPRTEGGTYIMFGATVAVYAAIAWHREGRKDTAWTLVAIALAFLGEAIAYKALDLWMQPLLCLLFVPFLVERCLQFAPRDASVGTAPGMDDPAFETGQGPDRRLLVLPPIG
jgi:alpha-1,2-mannosyltransferase